MKTKIITVALLCLLGLQIQIKASWYSGGELWWECMTGPNYTQAQQGLYKFHLILYRDCSGITPGYTQQIYTTVPGLSVINLSLVSTKDISPQCYDSTLAYHCINYNLTDGIVMQYKYESTSAGVQISGIPPANGWSFYYESCCRNAATNIPNASSNGMRLIAKMYPQGTKNFNPCFDNSPRFAEPPRVIMPVKTTNSFSSLAYDFDGDSIVYSLTAPLKDGGTPFTSYNTSYSPASPLPNAAVNSSNIALNLDPSTAYANFKSYNQGAFMLDINACSYKNGNKTGEIIRDYIIYLRDIDTNHSPNVSFPFPNPGGDILTTELYAGDTIQLSISGTDFQFNNGTIQQYVKIDAFGQDFGSFLPPNGSLPGSYMINGCKNPPCATLSAVSGPNYPYKVQMAASTTFAWQTAQNHLDSSRKNKLYIYNIRFSDDFCPVPAQKNIFLKVLVKPIPISKPQLISADVMNYNPDIKLIWKKFQDTLNTFQSYQIFQSNLPYSGFTLLDSVTNINDTILIIPNSQAFQQPLFYYVKLKLSRNGIFYSENSNTLQATYTDAKNAETTYQQWFPDVYKVTMKIENKGNTVLDTLELSYSLNGNPRKNELWVGQLLPNAHIYYDFQTDTISQAVGKLICSQISLTDFDTLNNPSCISIAQSINELHIPGISVSQVIPSPNNGIFKLVINSKSVVSADFHCYNPNGKLLASKKLLIKSGENEFHFDISNQKGGIYTFSINISGKEYFGKFVILNDK